jgi:hypothetical protein
MPLLSSSIVKHQLTTVHEVGTLARQSAHGGDLRRTLEIVSLSEACFRRAGRIVRARTRADRHLATRSNTCAGTRGVAQLRVSRSRGRSGTLVLAVSEPLPAEVEAISASGSA